MEATATDYLIADTEYNLDGADGLVSVQTGSLTGTSVTLRLVIIPDIEVRPGNYTLSVTCTDTEGNAVSVDIQVEVTGVDISLIDEEGEEVFDPVFTFNFTQN